MMITAFAAKRGLARLRVVTSAFHVPRCQLIFACVAPDREVVFHPAQDPDGIASFVAHETRARAGIVAQGGVIWDGRLFPAPQAAG